MYSRERENNISNNSMMVMIGDPPPSNPTVHIPSWEINHQHAEDPTAYVHSPSHYDTALERFLPSNKSDDVVREESENPDHDLDLPVDAFSCDDFRMFEFKVKKCARARSHDWTECPFAHPGEKARRRDPRRYHYSGDACPDYRRGACRNGDACEYAHGVFECWLHPSRYRTLPCKDGTHCRRRVCFFAHTPEQLRFLNSPDGSPRKQDPDPDPLPSFGSSPRSTLFVSAPSSPTTVSPPISPGASLKLGQLTEAMYVLQLTKMKMGLGHGLINSPPVWRLGFCSSGCPTKIRPGFMSLPSTPMRPVSRVGPGPFDPWDTCCQEEPAMERVESGKALREKIYAKIGKENSLDRTGPGDEPS